MVIFLDEKLGIKKLDWIEFDVSFTPSTFKQCITICISEQSALSEITIFLQQLPSSPSFFTFSALKPPERTPENANSSIIPSFWDKLIDPTGINLRSGPKVDLVKERIVSIDYINNNPLYLRIFVKQDYLDKLYESWRDVLIVKLLGKSISYDFRCSSKKGISSTFS